MADISFDLIKQALTRPKHRPTGDRLAVAAPPKPFVAPTFERADDGEGPLAEVILIRASAAVGKSTLAKALSASREIPVLDLSVTPVATGSFKGLLADLRNGSHPLDAFHSGDLPIIVDALDEGRVKSGEGSFFSFLQTTAETISESREVKFKPKLIMLGRMEAIAYAEMQFTGDGIEVSVLEVGYFDELGARDLVHAYAQQAAKEDSQYHIHKEPVEQWISTYFAKIEAALGLEPGQLWDSSHGRSFAGYAPVLAAIGTLLPAIENYADAINRLNDVGSEDAWGVIESVLHQIIQRDRDAKLAPSVEGGLTSPLPAEAYDREEQLTLLLQLVQGEPLKGTGRVRLSPSDLAKYEDGVRRWLPEHPFLRDGLFTNDVIASFVYAAAIANVSAISQSEHLDNLSRQPFLWRSIEKRLDEETEIDGRYLGIILNSFWSDPLTRDHRVTIRETEDGTAVVSIEAERGATTSPLKFQVAAPFILRGLLKNGDIDVRGNLFLTGMGNDATSRSFSFENSLVHSESPITLDAAKIRIAGPVWLDSEIAHLGAQLSLEFEKGAKYGWGQQLANKYPFSQHPGTLDQPHEEEGGKLERLLSECARRFTTGAALALNPDFSAPDGDGFTQWTNRPYKREFPILIDELVKHGLADTDVMPVRGSVGRTRVRLKESMQTIRNGVLSGEPPFADLAASLRDKIREP